MSAWRPMDLDSMTSLLMSESDCAAMKARGAERLLSEAIRAKLGKANIAKQSAVFAATMGEAVVTEAAACAWWAHIAVVKAKMARNTCADNDVRAAVHAVRRLEQEVKALTLNAERSLAAATAAAHAYEDARRELSQVDAGGGM